MTGLLAGLHEFPTAANVPVTTKPGAQAAMAHTVLSALLVSPPPPPPVAPPRGRARSSKPVGEPDGAPRHRSKPSGESEDLGDGGASLSALRMVKVVPAGDVLHVFSHIRKTYRTQWVVLQGGGGPPPLVPDPDLGVLSGTGVPPATKTKPGPQKKKAKKNDAAKTPAKGPTTQWVEMEAVADAKCVWFFKPSITAVRLDYNGAHTDERPLFLRPATSRLPLRRTASARASSRSGGRHARSGRVTRPNAATAPTRTVFRPC